MGYPEITERPAPKSRTLLCLLRMLYFLRQDGALIRKEETPMSVTDTIALLMLVLAAISLGFQIKK